MSMSRGQQLIGRTLDSYILEQLLGYGGSSAVYLARRQESEQRVAIKVFLPRSTLNIQTQRDFYRRFLREAEDVSALRHPHILSIIAFGSQEGLPYIVMPYMPGGTLREYVSQRGSLSLAEVQRFLEQIASALDFAHQQGFVHCDVKPANVLLDGEGNAVLADFGIARLVDGAMAQALAGQDQGSNGAASPAPRKSPAALMGTPDYISPEQALARPLDGRSDIYSLGITLYYLLTGQIPFRAESSVTVALMHVHEPPPPPGLWRFDITPAIDAVMQKALAKRPEDRYQSAGDLSSAFAEAVQLAAHSGGIDPAGRPALREPSGKMGSDARQKVHLSSPSVRLVPARARQQRRERQRVWVISAVIGVMAVLLILGGFFAFLMHDASGSPAAVNHSRGDPIDKLLEQDEWPTGRDFSFKGSQYYISNMSTRHADLALFAGQEYGDSHLTVTASEIHGSMDGADFYGVVLRASVDLSRYYLLEITAWDGGEFQFLRYANQQWKVLAGGPISSFMTGLDATNTISIDAKGNDFSFSVNNSPIGLPVVDSALPTLSTGEIGLYVEEQGTSVAFSHVFITDP